MKFNETAVVLSLMLLLLLFMCFTVFAVVDDFIAVSNAIDLLSFLVFDVIGDPVIGVDVFMYVTYFTALIVFMSSVTIFSDDKFLVYTVIYAV